jgi:hypothetical protein
VAGLHGDESLSSQQDLSSRATRPRAPRPRGQRESGGLRRQLSVGAGLFSVVGLSVVGRLGLGRRVPGGNVKVAVSGGDERVEARREKVHLVDHERLHPCHPARSFRSFRFFKHPP